MRTSNPTLRKDTFNRFSYLTGEDPAALMSVRGSINKALLLLAMTVASATVTWNIQSQLGAAAGVPWIIGGALIGFVLAIVICLKPNLAPVLAPVYALAEGCFLGALSSYFNALYPGIVIQAVGITFAVAASMLVAYQSRVIRATSTFKKVVISATAGIAVVYLASLGMLLFGVRMPFLNDPTPIGIGINLFVLVVAAMNLVLDFDLIEQGAEQGAPKFMEWYGGFSLVVTLLWIYVEVLRLLSKLRR